MFPLCRVKKKKMKKKTKDEARNKAFLIVSIDEHALGMGRKQMQKSRVPGPMAGSV